MWVRFHLVQVYCVLGIIWFYSNNWYAIDIKIIKMYCNALQYMHNGFSSSTLLCFLVALVLMKILADTTF